MRYTVSTMQYNGKWVSSSSLNEMVREDNNISIQRSVSAEAFNVEMNHGTLGASSIPRSSSVEVFRNEGNGSVNGIQVIPPKVDFLTVKSEPSTPTNSFSTRPCIFFASGTCRNGNQCRFSHSYMNGNNTPNSPSPRIIPNLPLPPAIIVNIPNGHPIYSVDVECVATAVQHNARSIAQVALVDEWSRPVFSVYVKQDMPVVSYITELTGLTKEILDTYGLSLGD
jgi:hypothetical protein